MQKRDQDQGGPQPNSCLASGADKPQGPLGISKHQAKGRGGGIWASLCYAHSLGAKWGPGLFWRFTLPSLGDRLPTSRLSSAYRNCNSLLYRTDCETSKLQLMTSGPSRDTSIRELEMGVELNYCIEREERE